MKNDKSKIIRVGIGVVIENEKGEILLGKRNQEARNAPNHYTKLAQIWDWQLPGGGLEYGEEFEDCAIRETKEETNLDIHNPRLLCAFNDKDENAHWITIGMLATEHSGEIAVNEPDKFIEWKWFAPDNLPENIFVPSMKSIEAFKNMPPK